MKITGIELLQKIKSGEEMPKKIKIYDDVYEYDKTSNDYVSIEDDDCFQDSYNIFQILNDEVEILEEEKGFSGMKWFKNGEEFASVSNDGLHCSQLPKEELEEIELLDENGTLKEVTIKNHNKINELIANQNKIIKELKNKETTKS